MVSLHGTSTPSEGLDGGCAPSLQTETTSTETFTKPAPAPAVNVDGAVKSKKRARSSSVAPSSTARSSKRQRQSPSLVDSEKNLDGYVITNGPIPELIHDNHSSQVPFLSHEYEAVPGNENRSEGVHPDLLPNTAPPVDDGNAYQQGEISEVIDLTVNENDQPSEPPKKRTKRKRAAEPSAALDEAKPEPKKRKLGASGTRTLIKAWETYGEAVENNLSRLQNVIAKEYGITVDLPALPFRPTNGLQVLEQHNDYSVTLEKDYNAEQERKYNALQDQYEQLESFTGGVQQSLMTMGTIERYLVKLLKRKSHIVDAICEKLGVEVPGDLTVPEPMPNPDTTSPTDSGVDIQTPKIVETVERDEPTDNHTPAPPSEALLEAAQHQILHLHGDDPYAFMQGTPTGGVETQDNILHLQGDQSYSFTQGTPTRGVETRTVPWHTGFPNQVQLPLVEPQFNNIPVHMMQPFSLDEASNFNYPSPQPQYTHDTFLQPQVPREDHSTSVDSMTQSLPSSGIQPIDTQHHGYDFLGNDEAHTQMMGFDAFLNNSEFIEIPAPATFNDDNKENGEANWFMADEVLDDGTFNDPFANTQVNQDWDAANWSNYINAQDYMVTPAYNNNGVYNNSVYNNTSYNNTAYNNSADNNDDAYN